MAPRAHQSVIDRDLIPEPGTIVVDRKERKAQAARFQKTRRIKQSFMGTMFLILLAAGWLYSLIGYFIPVCMVLGIGLAAFQGRSWCNWAVPEALLKTPGWPKSAAIAQFPRSFAQPACASRS